MLMSNIMPPSEAFGRARAAAQKALAIDNKLAEPLQLWGLSHCTTTGTGRKQRLT